MSSVARLVPLFFVLGVPVLAQAHPLDEVPPGHWLELSLNTIDDVDPCPAQDCSFSAVEGISGVVDDWCGGVFASGFGVSGGLVVHGGGHNGYFGSELYVFDIESQLWERYTEPYDDGSGSVAPACDDATGLYPDGSPCPTHTYDRVQYDPIANAFVLLFSTPDPVCGGCDAPYPVAFDFDDDAWSLGQIHPSPGPATGASTAYDPSRNSIWYLPAYNGQFAQYDLTAGQWTLYDNYNLAIDAVSAIDPGRDLFVTVEGRETGTVIVHDLADPMAGGVTVTLDGTSPVLESGANGFEWDPVSEQFIGWAGGTEVWGLVPPDGDWQTEAWSWLRLDAAADNAVTPTDPNGNGTYSRWRYVPAYNVFVVVNGTGDPVFAYRLTDDPGQGPNDPGGTTGGDDAMDSSGGTPADGTGASAGGGDTSGTPGDGSATTATGDATGGDASTAGASDDDGGGCSCHATGSPSHRTTWWAWTVLLVALRRRPRRSASAPGKREPDRDVEGERHLEAPQA